MRKMLVVASLVTATVATGMIATTDEAQAQRRWGRAIGFSIGAAMVTGAIIANSGPVYVESPTCRWVKVDRYDDDGNRVGVRRVQICDTTPY
jgi:hypothetical protein